MATRNVGFGAVATRETTEDEKRAHARERVAGRARAGEAPHERWNPDHLQWAFLHREDELEQLEREAEEAREAKIDRRRRAEQSKDLAAMTDRVLAEWDAVEQTARRQKAATEARRRLGLDGGGDE